MNEFGEPNMGNPSVRFDEGREMFWSLACRPLNPASPAYSTTEKFQSGSISPYTAYHAFATFDNIYTG